MRQNAQDTIQQLLANRLLPNACQLTTEQRVICEVQAMIEANEELHRQGARLLALARGTK